MFGGTLHSCSSTATYLLIFHTLRHTAATLMLENGEHPEVVQEMLGYTNISQTLNTYSHVTPNMQSGWPNDSVLF